MQLSSAARWRQRRWRIMQRNTMSLAQRAGISA